MSEPSAPSPWGGRLEALAGRRSDALVVAGVVVAVVGGGLALWSRGAPASIAPPARATASPGTTPGVGVEVVVVHVAGAVRHPGLIELPSGSRVADAIDAAGGALPRADLDLLNLAAPVADGTQIFVPGPSDTASPGPVAATSTPGAVIVNLNTADQTLLETVPGLGPVKAGAIVAYRTEIGGFTSIDQVLEVTGIGPATLESIRPFISL